MTDLSRVNRIFSFAQSGLVRPVKLSLLVLMAFHCLCGVACAGTEGRIAKLAIFNQVDETGATAHAQPYHFIASIRNSLTNHSATITPPETSTWSEIPLTVTQVGNLFGAHFYYDAGFADTSQMDSAFPGGDYTLGIHREHESAVSDFNVTIGIGPGGAPPVPNLEITNTTWANGALILDPESPILTYTGTGGNRFEWEMVGGGSGGGGGTATGSVDYSNINWAFGRSFVGFIRLVQVDNQVTVEDPNAPIGHTTASSTYESIRGAEVRLSIQMVEAPVNFNLIEARFTSTEGSFNIRPALLEEIQNNGIVTRMDVSRWTEWAAGNESGVVYIRYENEEGEFEVELPYSRDDWDGRVVVPTRQAVRIPISYANWARKNFPPSEWSDPLIWGQNADPDMDGRDNVMEYAEGTDPMSPEALPNRPLSIVEIGDYNYLSFKYSRAVATKAVISYQQSVNLSSWAPFFPNEDIAPLASNANKEEVTIQGPNPIDWQSAWFLRVNYAEPDGVTSLGEPGLIIVEALYGANDTFSDVTSILQSSVSDNSLTIQVTNSNMGGDPIFGVFKTLTVRYFFDEIEQTAVVEEGDLLAIP